MTFHTFPVKGHPAGVRSVRMDGQHIGHIWPYGDDEYATDVHPSISFRSKQEAYEALAETYLASSPETQAWRRARELHSVIGS